MLQQVRYEHSIARNTLHGHHEIAPGELCTFHVIRRVTNAAKAGWKPNVLENLRCRRVICHVSTVVSKGSEIHQALCRMAALRYAKVPCGDVRAGQKFGILPQHKVDISKILTTDPEMTPAFSSL